MGVRRVSRRVCGLRGQIPSLQTCTRVPGHLHRQWTALDLPFVCLNMSLFCGAARDGLGVKFRLGMILLNFNGARLLHVAGVEGRRL